MLAQAAFWGLVGASALVVGAEVAFAFRLSKMVIGLIMAFGVGALRHGEHALGAELDTEAASLTPFLKDVDDAMRHLDAISIQGLSPIGHSPSPIPR